MRCGEDGTECAVSHVAPKLRGRPTKTRRVAGHDVPWEWAARCPCCHAPGKLTLTAKGRSILRHCQKCKASQDDLTAALVKLLPGCFWPAGKARIRQVPVERADLAALALTDMPPMSLRLILLEMSGLSTPAALDKLGVRRENRARVINGRASFSMQNRR